jgi:hypothetical protein
LSLALAVIYGLVRSLYMRYTKCYGTVVVDDGTLPRRDKRLPDKISPSTRRARPSPVSICSITTTVRTCCQCTTVLRGAAPAVCRSRLIGRLPSFFGPFSFSYVPAYRFSTFSFYLGLDALCRARPRGRLVRARVGLMDGRYHQSFAVRYVGKNKESGLCMVDCLCVVK